MHYHVLNFLTCISILTGCAPPQAATEPLPINAAETTSLQDLERLAFTESQKGNYPKAIEYARKIITQNPNSLEAILLVGDASFMMGDMKQSIESFDRAIEIQPQLEPQLWQRGLALYYAGRFRDGQAQFETHQSYNSQDVENAVWHILCTSKTVGLEKARETFIPITDDTRVPMKQIHKLFGGTGDVGSVFQAAQETPALARSKAFQLYYAHLYTGLYYDMIGDRENSILQMRKASKLNPISKSQLMGSVADVHLMMRAAPKKEGTLKKGGTPKAPAGDASDR